MAQLAPVLVQPSYDAEPRQVGRGIEAIVKAYEDTIYVFAVNVDNQPRRFEMRMAGLPPVNQAEIVYGLADPVLGSGRLLAELEPLGTAVYRLQVAGI